MDDLRARQDEMRERLLAEASLFLWLFELADAQRALEISLRTEIVEPVSAPQHELTLPYGRNVAHPRLAEAKTTQSRRLRNI